jgi:hypothetical protein
MAREPVREIEVEVLPPEDTSTPRRAEESEAGPRVYTRETQQPPASEAKEFDDPLIALVSRLMDSAFIIPGTSIRFGFDPIIGLVAGYGDAASSITSLLLLFRSMKHGVPRVVIAQMAMNIVLNGTVGAIPLVGDAFSFWFKSNERNYALLKKHAGGTAAPASWLFLIAVVGGVGAILVLTVIAYASMVVMLIKALRGQ